MSKRHKKRGPNHELDTARLALVTAIIVMLTQIILLVRELIKP